MTDFAYGIIVSYTIPDLETGDENAKIITPILTQNDMHTINTVLRTQFQSPRYQCHLDHLMLFNVNIYQRGEDISILYIRSLAKIDHPLFIPSDILGTKLKICHPMSFRDVYSAFPRYAFDNMFRGNFVTLDHNDNININTVKENSQSPLWNFK
jgi:hypothetical protein